MTRGTQDYADWLKGRVRAAEKELNLLQDELRQIEFHAGTSSVPSLGEMVYAADNRRYPRIVVGFNDTQVITVPLHTNVYTGHKGNLFDEHGNRPWAD